MAMCEFGTLRGVGTRHKWGVSKWGLKVLVHNCPRLPMIVVILQRKFPLERGPKGPQKCNCRRLCANCRECPQAPMCRSFPPCVATKKTKLVLCVTFLHRWPGAEGSRSKNLLEGVLKEMLVQGYTPRLLDEVRESLNPQGLSLNVRAPQ